MSSPARTPRTSRVPLHKDWTTKLALVQDWIPTENDIKATSRSLDLIGDLWFIPAEEPDTDYCGCANCIENGRFDDLEFLEVYCWLASIRALIEWGRE